MSSKYASEDSVETENSEDDILDDDFWTDDDLQNIVSDGLGFGDLFNTMMLVSSAQTNDKYAPLVKLPKSSVRRKKFVDKALRWYKYFEASYASASDAEKASLSSRFSTEQLPLDSTDLDAKISLACVYSKAAGSQAQFGHRCLVFKRVGLTEADCMNQLLKQKFDMRVNSVVGQKATNEVDLAYLDGIRKNEVTESDFIARIQQDAETLESWQFWMEYCRIKGVKLEHDIYQPDWRKRIIHHRHSDSAGGVNLHVAPLSFWDREVQTEAAKLTRETMRASGPNGVIAFATVRLDEEQLLATGM